MWVGVAARRHAFLTTALGVKYAASHLGPLPVGKQIRHPLNVATRYGLDRQGIESPYHSGRAI